MSPLVAARNVRNDSTLFAAFCGEIRISQGNDFWTRFRSGNGATKIKMVQSAHDVQSALLVRKRSPVRIRAWAPRPF
jgi:hypothetical protein